MPEHDSNGAHGDEAPLLIVVVDTDPGVRWALEKGLRRSGYDVRTAVSAGELLTAVYEGPASAVVMELVPESGLGMELLSNLFEANENVRVLCTATDSEPKLVIECIRRGAFDFLPKPCSLEEIRASLSRALASERQQRALRRPDRAGPEERAGSLLIGISPAMQELRTTIQQISKTDLNLLIRGESGVGKDMVAREIHRLSPRSDKPFVKVNCTALPDELLESELFGYEKGAFTGAAGSKPGRFELANNGIIFLDEIGDIKPSLQAKLLQVIEHKEFTKLGGRQSIKVDVQIIAATNADIEERTNSGQFRDDLYFRLNEICLWVPKLAQRREDIPLLVRHFIQKHGRFQVEEGFTITGEDLSALMDADWPGNVRELESTIKRWLALGQKTIPTRKQSPGAPRPAGPVNAAPGVEAQEQKRLSQSADGAGAAPAPARAAEPSASPDDLAHRQVEPPREQSQPEETVEVSEADEAERIHEALLECKWNRRKAAEALGMSYQTLRRRIEKYNLAER
jgi:DNA-binding NtrC family response regulator